MIGVAMIIVRGVLVLLVGIFLVHAFYLKGFFYPSGYAQRQADKVAMDVAWLLDLTDIPEEFEVEEYKLAGRFRYGYRWLSIRGIYGPKQLWVSYPNTVRNWKYCFSGGVTRDCSVEVEMVPSGKMIAVIDLRPFLHGRVPNYVLPPGRRGGS